MHRDPKIARAILPTAQKLLNDMKEFLSAEEVKKIQQEIDATVTPKILFKNLTVALDEENDALFDECIEQALKTYIAPYNFIEETASYAAATNKEKYLYTMLVKSMGKPERDFKGWNTPENYMLIGKTAAKQFQILDIMPNFPKRDIMYNIVTSKDSDITEAILQEQEALTPEERKTISVTPNFLNKLTGQQLRAHPSLLQYPGFKSKWIEKAILDDSIPMLEDLAAVTDISKEYIIPKAIKRGIKRERIILWALQHKCSIRNGIVAAHEQNSRRELDGSSYQINPAALSTIKFLLANGGKPNDDPRNLIYAIRKRDLELVKLLLDHGADPNKQGEVSDDIEQGFPTTALGHVLSMQDCERSSTETEIKDLILNRAKVTSGAIIKGSSIFLAAETNSSIASFLDMHISKVKAGKDLISSQHSEVEIDLF